VQPRILLDTHILIRWIFESKKLSRSQLRELDAAARRGEPVAFSAFSLIEIAILASGEKRALKAPLEDLFRDLNSNPAFRVLPMTYEIALDVAALVTLRDPADRAIAATARVHHLKLVTSDQRIIDSKLVPVIE
jgi:PIN domain nuclease of toxin-antitoxin system